MSQSQSRRPNPLNQPKLLVVDDESDNLDLLNRAFHRQFQVWRAESGYQALEILAAHPDIAVIISDQRMPGMSGTELLSQAAEKYPDIMRIILTGYTDVEDLVGAINQGKVFKYVTKPWNDAELKAIVQQALEAYELIKARTADLNRVLRRETLVNQITHAIRSSLNPQKTFTEITWQLGQALKVDSCTLSLWTASSPKVHCVGFYSAATDGAASCPVPPEQFSDLPELEIPIAQNPILQKLIATRGPVIANTPEELNTYCQPLTLHHRSKALLVMPLFAEGEIIGSIGLSQANSPRHWLMEELELVKAVAAQAAIAVGQAKLYQTTRQQAEKLIELDRQKTEFFQSISHEFRTPLTLTLGPLETAVEQRIGLSLEQSQVALRNSRRLLRLVNQLLDIQRLHAGEMQPRFHPCNPVEFVEDIVEIFRTYCDRKSLQLRTDFHACPPIYIDPERFDKVVYNLLSNATKFTPAGGCITVQVKSKSNKCQIQVRDTGIGIRQDQLPFLFERFHQADGSSNRQHEGSGLGLALTKAIVELHGGSLWVDSLYQQGTSIILEFPFGKQHLLAEQIIETEATVQPQRAAVELADAELPQDLTTDNPGLNSNQPRILVVEDNADMRSYIAYILRQRGYQIEAATDGPQGLALALQTLPDLIITDWMMPEMAGIEFIRQVRDSASAQHVPIIMLTAKANETARIEGLETGADAYVSKPFNDRELLAEVHNLLALKANERQITELNQYLTDSVLKRFLPNSLVQKAALGQLQLDLHPEPRLVTIVFTDMVGFTQLSNLLGSRQIATLLNEYLDAMTAAIFEFGGTVDKFMGDGILALFGAPEELSASQQAQNAVASVQSMHQKLRGLNQKWQSQGIPKVQFRCGIHQGTAVVGMFGSANRTDFTAIGPSVNMAARLQEASAPDTIWASETVAKYLRPGAIANSQSVQLKGISETVIAYSLQIESGTGKDAIASPNAYPPSQPSSPSKSWNPQTSSYGL